MDKISIELEAVTATFLHVEPEGEARWRAAPFRGLARWWYRAILGAALPPEKVHSQEADLFGTAEAPSKVAIRVFDAASPSRSLKASVNPGSRQDARREGLEPGSRATLELMPTAHRGNTNNAVQAAYASIWTALHLGGIGQRSRRGAGSLRMLKVTGYDGPLQPIREFTPQEHSALLAGGLFEVQKILVPMNPLNPSVEPAYPCLHPGFARIAVALAPWGKDEMSVRIGIMNSRRDCHRQPYHPGQPEHEFGAVKNGRLSSPLWVRVADISGNQSLIVLTLMKHAGASSKGAQWSYVEKFMKHSCWSNIQTVAIPGRQS